MTDMKTTKITLATVKSFIKKNAGKLFIKVISDFDGMTDGLEFKKGAQFEKAESETRLVEETLGIKGAWFVGQSRDYFSAYEDDQFIGIHVYNSCGSFDIAIEKSPSPVECPEEEDLDVKKLAEKPNQLSPDSGQHQRNPIYPSPSDLLYIEGGMVREKLYCSETCGSTVLEILGNRGSSNKRGIGPAFFW